MAALTIPPVADLGVRHSFVFVAHRQDSPRPSPCAFRHGSPTGPDFGEQMDAGTSPGSSIMSSPRSQA
jgi:hypothetical protein